MATRIQSKSRTTKRPQATASYSTAGGTLSAVTGKFPKTDQRGFPLYAGADTVRTAVTVVA